MLGREFQKHFSSPGGAEYFVLSGLRSPNASRTQGSASLPPGLRVLRAFGTLSVNLSHHAHTFVQLSAEFLASRKIM